MKGISMRIAEEISSEALKRLKEPLRTDVYENGKWKCVQNRLISGENK